MEKKYKFLRIAATIYKVVAWIVLVVGVISSIAMGIAGTLVGGVVDNSGGGAGVLVAIMGIIYSVVMWIGMLAIAELFYLFMDVEQNTRETSERLTKIER